MINSAVCPAKPNSIMVIYLEPLGCFQIGSNYVSRKFVLPLFLFQLRPSAPAMNPTIRYLLKTCTTTTPTQIPSPASGAFGAIGSFDPNPEIVKPKPSSFQTYCRPLINKPPPLNRDDNRDPDIKALKRSGVIDHGSPLRQP